MRDTAPSHDGCAEISLDRGYAHATMADIAGLQLLSSTPSIPWLVASRLCSDIWWRPPFPGRMRRNSAAIFAPSARMPDPERKLGISASALCRIQPRPAPLFSVLQSAVPLHPDLGSLWQDIAGRRAANIILLAENLTARGRMRPDVSVATAGGVIWSMNSPGYHLLLVEQRGWKLERFERWIGDVWTRRLLKA